MDNAARYGLRPFRGRHAADFAPVWRHVASAYQAAPGAVNVPLQIGDPVIRVNDGSVAIATGTGVCFGVIVGVGPYWNAARGLMEPTSVLPGGTVWGTNTERRSMVLVLPTLGNLFEIDCDDAVTATTEATYRSYIGENGNIAFSPQLGIGAFPKFDISTHNTTNTLPWQIQDVSPSRLNQDFSGLNVKLIVSCNLPDESPNVATGV